MRHLSELPGLEIWGPEGTKAYVKIARSVYPNPGAVEIIRAILDKNLAYYASDGYSSS